MDKKSQSHHQPEAQRRKTTKPAEHGTRPQDGELSEEELSKAAGGGGFGGGRVQPAGGSGGGG
jgi:hypothetical protein